MRTDKVWFKTLREAKNAQAQRRMMTFDYVGTEIFRQKEGRHKGEYFVGSHIDFINRY